MSRRPISPPPDERAPARGAPAPASPAAAPAAPGGASERSSPETELERLREHARWREAMFAALIHDLRNPLNSVITWSHLLREGQLDDDAARRALDTVRRNAELQVRMLEDFVEYSALAEPDPALEREPVDLATLVGATISGLRPRAAARSIEFDGDLGVGRERVTADRRRLELAVKRLLEHAIDAAPPSSRVAVALRFTAADAELEIRHSGGGVQPDELARALEPVSGPGHGRGNLRLELALAARVARLHGGRLEARVEPSGSGSILVLRVARDLS